VPEREETCNVSISFRSEALQRIRLKFSACDNFISPLVPDMGHQYRQNVLEIDTDKLEHVLIPSFLSFDPRHV
jgi:hypothetical protein